VVHSGHFKAALIEQCDCFIRLNTLLEYLNLLNTCFTF